MDNRFFYCNHCGNLVGMLNGNGNRLVCCGVPMTNLKSQNEYDEGSTKHSPVIKREGDELYVTVGALSHPMTDEHHIEWIYLETLRGGIRKTCIDRAATVFSGNEGIPVAVYAYCNLHGLWKTEL